MDFTAREVRHFIPGVLDLLSGAWWVNGRDAQSRAERKPNQLAAAQAVGWRVPRTLMTNDPKRCIDFLDLVGGEIVYKPFGFHMRDEDGTVRALYTSKVSRRTLMKNANQIDAAPCIFQEFIPKRLELRVTAMGGKYFTLEIDTSKSMKASVDWRHYDLSGTSWNRGGLPHEVELKIDPKPKNWSS